MTFAIAHTLLAVGYSLRPAGVLPSARAVRPPATMVATTAQPAPGLDKVFRRAEFWDNRTCTVLDIVNVLGRWESAQQWKERTTFLEVAKEDQRKEIEENSWTRKRYDMAQRMGMAERVALVDNLVNMGNFEFTNEKLAKSVGMTLDDFASMNVSKAACNVVYDALAESRSGLIAPSVIDARRASFINAEGGFNELAFTLGLMKARFVVVCSWFLFGKGNFIWVLVAAQFLHDARPDLFPTPKELGLFKIGTFI